MSLIMSDDSTPMQPCHWQQMTPVLTLNFSLHVVFSYRHCESICKSTHNCQLCIKFREYQGLGLRLVLCHFVFCKPVKVFWGDSQTLRVPLDVELVVSGAWVRCCIRCYVMSLLLMTWLSHPCRTSVVYHFKHRSHVAALTDAALK